MSAFPFILSIPDAEVYNLYTDRRFTLGQLAQTLDGRKFRFALNGAALLVPGDCLQAAAPITAHLLMTPAAAAVGATSAVTALGATAVTIDQYRDGVYSIELGTGFGFAYPVDKHGAQALSTNFTVPFKRGVTIQVAIPTTANSVSLIYNSFNGVVQSPTTLTAQPVGFACSAIPASGTPPATPQFGWVQVGGLIAATTIGTVVIGSNVMVPTTTAGGVAPVAAGTTPVVGTVAHVATTTNKSTIMIGGVIN